MSIVFFNKGSNAGFMQPYVITQTSQTRRVPFVTEINQGDPTAPHFRDPKYNKKAVDPMCRYLLRVKFR